MYSVLTLDYDARGGACRWASADGVGKNTRGTPDYFSRLPSRADSHQDAKFRVWN